MYLLNSDRIQEKTRSKKIAECKKCSWFCHYKQTFSGVEQGGRGGPVHLRTLDVQQQLFNVHPHCCYKLWVLHFVIASTMDLFSTTVFYLKRMLTSQKRKQKWLYRAQTLYYIEVFFTWVCSYSTSSGVYLCPQHGTQIKWQLRIRCARVR